MIAGNGHWGKFARAVADALSAEGAEMVDSETICFRTQAAGLVQLHLSPFSKLSVSPINLSIGLYFESAYLVQERLYEITGVKSAPDPTAGRSALLYTTEAKNAFREIANDVLSAVATFADLPKLVPRIACIVKSHLLPALAHLQNLHNALDCVYPEASDVWYVSRDRYLPAMLLCASREQEALDLAKRELNSARTGGASKRYIQVQTMYVDAISEFIARGEASKGEPPKG